MNVLQPYIFKTVSAQFFGKRFLFKTSQELFSCNALDAGSMLLLNSIISECILSSSPAILDVGCGTGALSLAMLSHYPEGSVVAVDRDALALAFTEMNCRDNGFRITTASSLGGSGVFDRTFNLVMSNIPAKAGMPVIATMLADFSRLAGDSGVAAVVIVKTLADFAERTMRDAHGEIVFIKKTREYTVFHYRNMDHDGINTALAPYLRTEMTWSSGARDVMLHTVYGLPEFDSPGFSSQLILDILGKKPLSGSVLVVNPLQGLIPVYLMAEYGAEITTMQAAGRDMLSLAITEKNVYDVTGRKISTHHCPTLQGMIGCFDAIVILYVKEAVEGAHELLLNAISPLLVSGGLLFITGSSTSMHRFDNIAGNVFSKFADKKSRGFRGLGFSRKD